MFGHRKMLAIATVLLVVALIGLLLRSRRPFRGGDRAVPPATALAEPHGRGRRCPAGPAAAVRPTEEPSALGRRAGRNGGVPLRPRW